MSIIFTLTFFLELTIGDEKIFRVDDVLFEGSLEILFIFELEAPNISLEDIYGTMFILFFYNF